MKNTEEALEIILSKIKFGNITIVNNDKYNNLNDKYVYNGHIITVDNVANSRYQGSTITEAEFKIISKAADELGITLRCNR